MDMIETNRRFRDHEFIVTKANGWRSQDDGVAAVDIEAGDTVYLAAGVEAMPATVVSSLDLTAVAVDPTSAGTFSINGVVVEVMDGDDIQSVLGAITAALNGVEPIDAQIDDGYLVLQAVDAETSIEIGGEAQTLQLLGLEAGITFPTAEQLGGYTHVVSGLSEAALKTVGFAFATVRAGEGVSVLSRDAEYNRNRVTFPTDAQAAADALAALEAKSVFGL